MTPVACELLLSGRGLVVSWQGPYGPAVAEFSRPTSLSPEWSTYLSASVVPDAPPPSIAWFEHGVAVSYLTGDAAAVATLGPQGGFGLPPVRVHPGACGTAVAVEGDELVVAGVDAEGLVVSRLDPRSGLDVRWTRRVSGGRDFLPHVRVLPVEHGVLVVYAPRGGQALGVVRVDRDLEQAPRDVRHALRGRLASLHAIAVRGTGVVALGYGPPHDAVVDAAVLDARGAMRERPYAAIRTPGAKLSGPRAVWLETGAGLSVLDETRDTVQLESLGDAGSTRLSLPGLSGAHATAWFRSQLVGMQVLRDGDEATVRIVRAGAGGEQTSDAAVPCTPRDTARRRRAAEASTLLAAVHSVLRVGGGYRDAGASARLSPDGLELSMEDAAGAACVRIDPDPPPYRLVLTASVPGTDPPEPAPPSSLVRLARWIRVRFSKRAAALAEAEEAEARAVVAGTRNVTVEHVALAGAAATLRIACAVLPPAAMLLTWIERLRAAASSPGSHAGPDA